MTMTNNKGIGTVELITMLGFILVILAIGLGMFFNNNDSHKFDVFIKNASSTFVALSQFRDTYPKYGNIVYLKEAIDNDSMKEIKNPFSEGKYCDLYETKLEVINNTRYITLKCGDYIIYRYKPNNGPYQIYKVGSWVENITDDGIESGFVYNYYDNNKNLVFDEYLQLPEFLENYNNNEGTNIHNINDISNDKLVSKVVYRSRTLVKEISEKSSNTLLFSL